MTSPVAIHLYDEVMKEFSNSGHDRISSAFERQKSTAISWIERAVNELGIDETVSFLNDCISANETYDGGMPFFGDLVEAMGEIAGEGIERDTQEFRSVMEHFAENGSFQGFTTDGDGNSTPIGDNPHLVAQRGQRPAGPLQEALSHQNQLLKFHQGDDDMVESIERTIATIEKQMGDSQPQPQDPAGGFTQAEREQIVEDLGPGDDDAV